MFGMWCNYKWHVAGGSESQKYAAILQMIFSIVVTNQSLTWQTKAKISADTCLQIKKLTLEVKQMQYILL